MATLRYLNTFIDEEPTGRVFEARSKSWPQLGGLGHAMEEIEGNVETQAASYVAELEARSAECCGGRDFSGPNQQRQPWSSSSVLPPLHPLGEGNLRNGRCL